MRLLHRHKYRVTTAWAVALFWVGDPDKTPNRYDTKIALRCLQCGKEKEETVVGRILSTPEVKQHAKLRNWVVDGRTKL